MARYMEERSVRGRDDEGEQRISEYIRGLQFEHDAQGHVIEADVLLKIRRLAQQYGDLLSEERREASKREGALRGRLEELEDQLREREKDSLEDAKLPPPVDPDTGSLEEEDESPEDSPGAGVVVYIDDLQDLKNKESPPDMAPRPAVTDDTDEELEDERTMRKLLLSIEETGNDILSRVREQGHRERERIREEGDREVRRLREEGESIRTAALKGGVFIEKEKAQMLKRRFCDLKSKIDELTQEAERIRTLLEEELGWGS